MTQESLHSYISPALLSLLSSFPRERFLASLRHEMVENPIKQGLCFMTQPQKRCVMLRHLRHGCVTGTTGLRRCALPKENRKKDSQTQEK